MSFDIDKQTIRDLELFPEKKNDKSIFSVYKKTSTIGGRELLYDIFSSPVSDLDFLQNRKKEINFFVDNDCFIKLNSGQLDYIEYYLRNQRVPLRNNIIDAAYDRVRHKLKPDSDYRIISEGILHILRLLNNLNQFIADIKAFLVPSTLDKDLANIENFICSKSLKKALVQSDDLSFSQINNLDFFFRSGSKKEFRVIIEFIYKIDVLQTLSQLIKNDGFTLPEFSLEVNPVFEIYEAVHPFLPAPVSNSFTFSHDSNLCFITGPNMSGKSTFLKTVGVMIYLAHLGFPVPAKKFTTSIFDGLFTTINLSDNLNQGYSHFYSEVKRVREETLHHF
jgi:hypothetical protein